MATQGEQGGAVAPVVLTVFGILLALSSSELSDAIAGDPFGALTTLLPTWYLVPFIVVAVLGLVGGAVLDIYSSGLALLTLGIKVRRPVAAAIDGVIGRLLPAAWRSGQLLPCSNWAKPISERRARSCGVSGVPWRRR